MRPLFNTWPKADVATILPFWSLWVVLQRAGPHSFAFPTWQMIHLAWVFTVQPHHSSHCLQIVPLTFSLWPFWPRCFLYVECSLTPPPPPTPHPSGHGLSKTLLIILDVVRTLLCIINTPQNTPFIFLSLSWYLFLLSLSLPLLPPSFSSLSLSFFQFLFLSHSLPSLLPPQSSSKLFQFLKAESFLMAKPE